MVLWSKAYKYGLLVLYETAEVLRTGDFKRVGLIALKNGIYLRYNAPQ